MFGERVDDDSSFIVASDIVMPISGKDDDGRLTSAVCWLGGRGLVRIGNSCSRPPDDWESQDWLAGEDSLLLLSWFVSCSIKTVC